MSSVGALLVSPGGSAYQASKLAVLKFTEHIQAEYREQGVLAFSVHPGNIPTDIQGSNVSDEVMAHIFVDSLELGADSIVYLTKERREWLNGRFVNVIWDIEELIAKKDIIVRDDKLRIKLDLL